MAFHNITNLTTEELIQQFPGRLYDIENPSDDLINIFINSFIERIKQSPDMLWFYKEVARKHNLTDLLETALILS